MENLVYKIHKILTQVDNGMKQKFLYFKHNIKNIIARITKSKRNGKTSRIKLFNDLIPLQSPPISWDAVRKSGMTKS